MIQIIGGSGFVGSRLISLIGEDKCMNLDKIQSPFYSDITTLGDIRFINQIDIPKNTKSVVLLAAEHKDNVTPTSLYYDVNVHGTRNVLNAMDKSGVRNLIFTSSVAIYGLNKLNPDESHLQDPFNNYGKSKWEAELVIKEWFNSDPKNKSVIIIRPTVIFGERNRGNVYNLLKQISSGRFIIIGKGQNKKSMAYIGNITAFIASQLNNSEKGYFVFNYSDKPDFSMKELTMLVKRKMNIELPKYNLPYWLGIVGGYFFDLLSFLIKKKLPISSVRVKKFCATTQFNSSKAMNIFNPPFSLEEGLNNTLEYEFIDKKKDDVKFFSK